MPILSGKDWVSRFPNSNRVEDLKEPFRTRAAAFVDALRKANATVSISSTYRPPERAYLMHYAYLVAKGLLDPSAAPANDGVGIDWIHRDAQGGVDLAASRHAAGEMVAAYGIVFAPSLSSRHTEGLAIDMDISWQGALPLARPGGGGPAVIQSLPHTGANQELHAFGAQYGVFKLLTDPPHWSVDGH